MNPSAQEPLRDNQSSSTLLKLLPLWLAAIVLSVGFRASAQVTFDPANYTFEAEDFNFQGGGFFDNPVPCDTLGGAPNCYYDRVGYTNIDQLELNFDVTAAVGITNEVYRWGSSSATSREEWVDTYKTDDSLVRTQYSNAGLPDWEVRNIAVGEWLNYTRTFPAGNYNVYMRASSPGGFTAQLHQVDNATTTNQSLTYLGQFSSSSATSGYEFIPLTDFTGTNDIVLHFPGSTPVTVRETALSSGFVPNFYMLVASTNSANLPPLVQITDPAAGATLLEGVTVSVQATASDSETSVTNVQFYAGTEEPLTLIGETNAGPYSIDWTPPALGSIRTYTIRVVATDTTGLAGSDEIRVEVRDPNIEIVTTADGNGADAEMREETDLGVSSGGNYGSVRARTGSGNNEIIALRFDLTGKTLAALSDVRLNLISMRDDGSNRQLALYGVAPGTAGATGPYTTENWSETNLLEFGYMPGLLATDGDMTTQSLNTNSLTLLGYGGGTAVKGEVKTFGDAAVTDFMRSINGSSQVTFLVAFAPTYTSSGQARFASKEASTLDGGTPVGAEGDFAPFLQFKVLASVPPQVTITNPVDGATLDGGVGVTISADATDSDGSVTNVDFYAGITEPLTLIGSDTTAPYSMPWTPVALNPQDVYTIRVVATDNTGGTGEDSINVTVVKPAFSAVSTAFGNGADTEMREQDNPTASRNAATDLNTRFNALDRNEVVGLKFDLSGYTLSELQNVALNLINYRNNSTRVINIYGVTQGATGGTGAFSTETWTDSGDSTVQAWGDLPGLLVSDNNVATESLDTNNLTLLVSGFTITSLDEGTVEQATSPELTSFVQNYSGSSLITLLITAGNTSGGQFRFASKEATQTDTGVLTGSAGDLAPYLSFTVGAVMPNLEYSVTGGGTGINFSWTGSFKLQYQTNSLGMGLSTSWMDYPGGSTSGVTVPIDPTQGAVFFRLAP